MENLEGMRFPPRETKSRTYCCVSICKSRASKDPTIRFHHFPPPETSFVDIIDEFGKKKKVDRRKAWEIALRMKKDVTGSMRVCSLHFTRNNYILPDVPAMSRYLKANAVPSCNLPTSTDTKKLKNSRARGAKRQKRTQRQSSTSRNRNSIETTDELYTPHAIRTRLFLKSGTETTTGVTSVYGDFGIDNIGERDLELLTGISNFSVLENVTKIVVNAAREVENDCGLSVRRQIVMTFMRLKHDFGYSVLGVMFHCRRKNCEKIVLRMLDILGSLLKYAIPRFARASEFSRDLSLGREKNDKSVLIIDCVEIFIRRPAKVFGRVDAYFPSTGRNSVKFMIGTEPNGIISFVSKSYNSRTSNSTIFESSGIVDSLDKNDAIVEAEHFYIDEICRAADLRLLKIRSTSDDERLSKDGISFGAQRLKKNLKTFRILGKKIPADLTTKIDQIFITICAVLNLNSGNLSYADLRW